MKTQEDKAASTSRRPTRMGMKRCMFWAPPDERDRRSRDSVLLLLPLLPDELAPVLRAGGCGTVGWLAPGSAVGLTGTSRAACCMILSSGRYRMFLLFLVSTLTLLARGTLCFLVSRYIPPRMLLGPFSFSARTN